MRIEHAINHVMVDIETFGTGRDAAIVSIGACLFNPVTGRWPRAEDDMPETAANATFYQKVDLSQGPRAHAGKIDPDTVEWWLKQSDEARRALISGLRLPLQDSLKRFTQWIGRTFAPAFLNCYNTDVRLWSNGPTFDEDIMRDAYARCELSFPFHFKSSRCCRTAFDMAVQAGWNPRSVEKNELKHDALADALFQAQGICAMYAHLGLTQDPVTELREKAEGRDV